MPNLWLSAVFCPIKKIKNAPPYCTVEIKLGKNKLKTDNEKNLKRRKRKTIITKKLKLCKRNEKKTLNMLIRNPVSFGKMKMKTEKKFR